MFSTIDYMLMDPQLVYFRTDHFVHFVHSSEWTDHALLPTQFTFTNNPDFGKGLWRANPQPAHNTYFRQRLLSQLDDYHHTHLASDSTDLTPQDVWDQVKELTHQVAKSCSRRQSE
ncbi:hypothetical protein PS15p_204005 [Mucor circinelloides]